MGKFRRDWRVSCRRANCIRMTLGSSGHLIKTLMASRQLIRPSENANLAARGIVSQGVHDRKCAYVFDVEGQGGFLRDIKFFPSEPRGTR